MHLVRLTLLLSAVCLAALLLFTWDEQDSTFSTTQGLLYHLVSIAVQHNQLYYDILYYAPTVVYNEAVQKYFQPMLDSVQFQS